MMNAFTRATDALTSVLPFRSTKPKMGDGNGGAVMTSTTTGNGTTSSSSGSMRIGTGKDARISPLAVVDPRATIGEGCEIGPYCIVGPDVVLGPGNKLLTHVVITGHTTVGRDNVFHAFSVIGDAPQDLKYKGENTGVQLGDRNQIREHVTIHAGTAYGAKINGGGITRVGDDNLLMVNCHLAHDVQIGSRNVLANNVMVAGHCVLTNNIVLNGGVGINAWVMVNDFAYIAGYSQVHHDVPPFVKVSGNDEIRALNDVALRRNKFSEPDIEELAKAVRDLFSRRKPLALAMAELSASSNGSPVNAHVTRLIDALKQRNQGKHGRYLESLRFGK